MLRGGYREDVVDVNRCCSLCRQLEPAGLWVIPGFVLSNTVLHIQCTFDGRCKAGGEQNVSPWPLKRSQSWLLWRLLPAEVKTTISSGVSCLQGDCCIAVASRLSFPGSSCCQVLCPPIPASLCVLRGNGSAVWLVSLAFPPGARSASSPTK